MEQVNVELDGKSYLVALHPESGGAGFTVISMQFPEAVTYGATREEALAKISGAVGMVLQDQLASYNMALQETWEQGAAKYLCSCKACGQLDAILEEEAAAKIDNPEVDLAPLNKTMGVANG